MVISIINTDTDQKKTTKAALINIYFILITVKQGCLFHAINLKVCFITVVCHTNTILF